MWQQVFGFIKSKRDIIESATQIYMIYTKETPSQKEKKVKNIKKKKKKAC